MSPTAAGPAAPGSGSGDARSEATATATADRVTSTDIDGLPLGAFVSATLGLLGGFNVYLGLWALLWPRSFADFVDFDHHLHFLHDVGAFQIGLGVMLLLALIWQDAVAVVLAAFVVGNTIHAVNHAVDLDDGGRASDPWLLGALSLVAAVAFVRRYRQLDYLLGRTGTMAGTPELTRFVRQKTVSLTSFRRDGRPVSTPVSIVVDGDRAVVRSYEKAWKTRRIANNPAIEMAPSTAKGTPTGPAVTGRARRLSGTESRRAARLVRRKYPFLHGLLVPLAHRAMRAKTGRTVHFEVTLADAEPRSRVMA